VPLVAIFGRGALLNELQKCDSSRKNITMGTRFFVEKLPSEIYAVTLLVVPRGSANTKSKIADFEFASGAYEYVT
jgi:hypothetical protein